MSIAFGFHPLALALALLLAGALTWWTYRRTTPPISSARRATLIGLRWLSLSLVLLLLAEPVIRTVLRSTQTPILAVLLDTSRSLSDAVHPGEDYATALTETLARVADAAGDAEIRTFTFGADVRDWAPESDTIAFDGGRTDITTALEDIRSRFVGQPLRGIVLVSDGRYNTGSNPLYTAESYPVPIHTVVVGDTATYRDLRIENIATNEIGYVDREMPVQITLHANGYGGRSARVHLTGSNIAARDTTVVLPPDEAEIRFSLSMTPSTEGFHRFEAAVDALDGERTTANNRTSFSARILRRKLSVLFLAAGPSPDVAAVREMLQADPDLEIDARTQKSGSEWYEGAPPPSSLDRFDVVILAGYPGRQADSDILDAVAESRKPVLFLLDRTTDLHTVREKLGPVLPVSVQTMRQGFVDASAVESASGRTHPILNISGDLERLPPLSYSSSRWEATPDARTLATVSIRGVPLDEPLLVVRTRSGTRSAAILAAGIWRWRNVPTDLSDLDRVFPELLANLLQWIATKSDDRPVRVRPNQEIFDGGEAAKFSGEVYNESLEPIGDASLVLSVTDPAGSTLEYRMESIGAGTYSRGLGRLPKGTYRYRAVAEKDGVTLGADSGQFAVGELLLEFQDSQADPDLMRGIARRSGGAFVHFAELASLRNEGFENASLETEQIEEESQLALRRFLPILFVIVVLLSAEWIIRKRSGMV